MMLMTPGHSGGVEARRRVVDDLDRCDVGGRDVVEAALAPESSETRLSAVDQHGDLIAPPERDPAFFVDRHPRQAPKCVEHGSGRLGRSLAEPVDVRVDPGRTDRLRRDGDAGQIYHISKENVSEVVGGVDLGYEELALFRVQARGTTCARCSGLARGRRRRSDRLPVRARRRVCRPTRRERSRRMSMGGAHRPLRRVPGPRRSRPPARGPQQAGAGDRKARRCATLGDSEVSWPRSERDPQGRR